MNDVDSRESNVIHPPEFTGPPVENPRTRGRPKGTISFRTKRRERSMTQDVESYHPSVTVTIPKKGLFHYPKELLLQKGFCEGGGGVWHAPSLAPYELVSDSFLSPLQGLLNQLEKEGHDVSGARLEYLALREATARIGEIQTYAMTRKIHGASVLDDCDWPAIEE